MPNAETWVCVEGEKPEIPEEIAISLKYHIHVGDYSTTKYACYCKNYSIKDNKIRLEGVLSYHSVGKGMIWQYHNLTEFYKVSF